MSGYLKVALWIALGLLISVQISHIRIDFASDMWWKSTLVAGAFIIGINTVYSAAFEHWRQNGVTKPLIVVIALTVFCSYLSVSASHRAFAKNKHQTIMNEEAGPAAAGYKNQMNIANNTMVELGDTESQKYKDAEQKFTEAEAKWKQAVADSKDTGQSATAKAMSGGKEDADMDARVNFNSWLQALGLEFLCAAISIMLGIGAPLQTRAAKGFMMETEKAKKT